MNPIYSQISLDLQHKSIEPVNLKQYDYEARSILFYITDNGSPYILTDNMLAEIKIHKPDGTKVVAQGTINVGSNEIYVKVTRQMTSVYGVLCADVTLFREDRLLSTMPFHLHVEQSPVQNEDIDSSDEYTLLEDLIAHTQKNEKLRQANEQARIQEEEIRMQNEQARTQEEQTRIQNEQARMQEELIRMQNEQARTQEEQTRIQNEQARTQGEQSRIQEEQSRAQEEQARVQEELARTQREVEQQKRVDTLLSNVRIVAQNTSDAAADLQRKLDSHHFVLTEDKSTAGGVAALDTNGKIPDVELYEASTSRKGITQLTDSVTSNSTTTAATPSSVKTVYDAVVEVGSKKHTHNNKPVLDGITAAAVGQWNAAANRADTWRGIQDNLTSTSAVDSLSANQGRVLKELIDSKTSTPTTIPWSGVTGKPGSYPPSAHTHDDRYYTEAEVNSLLSGKAGNGHTHDDRYYTEGEVNNLLAAKAASNHSHGNMGTWEWKENGQPAWLWSSNEPGAGFLTSPSKLSVGYANSAGSAAAVNSEKVIVCTSSEGGNIKFISPKGRAWELDAYDENMRIFNYEGGCTLGITIDGGGRVRMPNGMNTTRGQVNTLYFGNTQMKIYSDNHQLITFRPENEIVYGMFYGVYENMWGLSPTDGGRLTLGRPIRRWGQIYSTVAAISTSDRTLKKDINLISDKYLDFFALLKPVSYRLVDGTSGRIHVGFVSQDVEAAMAQVGLSDLDFAGFCRDEVDDTVIYSLRYEEFIALNTAVIQHQQAKMDNFEQRLEKLEKLLFSINANNEI